VLIICAGSPFRRGETDLGNIAEEALDTCLERKSSDDDDDHWVFPASTQQSVQPAA
jgi:hypothetical protein